MRIGIVGSGRIGSTVGARLAHAGHDVVFSGSRTAGKLESLANSVPRASAASPAEAVSTTDAVVFAVRWTQIDDVLRQAGPLEGRIVIDTTNQFGARGVEDLNGASAIATNARRMPGARVAKAFNTYTSGFQRDVGQGRLTEAVAMFFASLDESAVDTTAAIVADCNFVPIRLATAAVELMEAPRRRGAVYGEAYRPDDARRIAAAAATADLDLAGRLADELKLGGRL
jgi:8-hydroxy-5-deazaflavin:NADPH oxidoreductase